MTVTMPDPSLAADTDRTRKQAADLRVRRGSGKKRTRTIKVLPVNLEVDETADHYLVFISPRPEAQALGISYHRSRLAKCGCHQFGGRGNRCAFCRGWSAQGMARYVGRLLRSYPKVAVTVPVEQLQVTRAVRQPQGFPA